MLRKALIAGVVLALSCAGTVGAEPSIRSKSADKFGDGAVKQYLSLHKWAVKNVGRKVTGRNVVIHGESKKGGGVRLATKAEFETTVGVLERWKNPPAPAVPVQVSNGPPQVSSGGGAGLAAIADCESGGNPRAIGGGGLYRGKYQFHRDTWEAVGGVGDPAAAPEAEQDKRAAILMQQSGPGQWPVCGQ